MRDLVVHMNELTSEDEDKIPFPAKQQLGDHGGLRDARSGNGINDYDLAPESGGHGVEQVTYHLGTDQQTEVHRPQDRDERNSDATTQRQVPGRNERISESSGDQRDTAASSGSSGDVPNGSIGEVMRWVGDDKDRARRALEVEQDRPTPRQSLVTQLNDRV